MRHLPIIIIIYNNLVQYYCRRASELHFCIIGMRYNEHKMHLSCGERRNKDPPPARLISHWPRSHVQFLKSRLVAGRGKRGQGEESGEREWKFINAFGANNYVI